MSRSRYLRPRYALRALGGATAQGREDWLLAFEYLAGLLDVG